MACGILISTFGTFTNLVEFFKATSNYVTVINRIVIRSLVNVENPYHVASTYHLLDKYEWLLLVTVILRGSIICASRL